MRFMVFLLLLSSSGCAYINYKAEPDEIVSFARKKQAEGALNNLLWYRGRDGKFDYFKYVYGMFRERRFKVPEGSIEVPKVFPLTSDSGEWITIHNIGNKWEFYD